MRNKRTLALSMMLIALGLFAAATADAGVKGFAVEPMDKTFVVNGVAKMTTQGKLERFGMRLFTGEIKDGTMLRVWAVRADTDERVPAAMVEVVLGSTLLQVNNREHITPIFPFKLLREIYIELPGYGDVAHGVVPRGTNPSNP